MDKKVDSEHSLHQKLVEWKKKIRQETSAQSPPQQEEIANTSGIPVDILYLPQPMAEDEYFRKQGFPGEYPFTRGIHPSMYRGRLWTMRQYAGYGSAKESNKYYKYLLSEGQMGLSVAFDLPTQLGYDSDDPITLGEVGKVGVAIDTRKDMEILFDGIHLDQVSTSMTINAPAAMLLAFYVVAAEESGTKSSQLRGTVQNDILKEYIARGTYIFSPKPSLRLTADLIRFCSLEIPQWNSISVSGYHIREAGSTAVQEVAFTLADGIEYVKAAQKAGLDVDRFAGRISFFFSSHNDP